MSDGALMFVRDLVRSSRMVAAGAFILVAFISAPAVAHVLDKRGLPGGVFVAVEFLILVLFSAAQLRPLGTNMARAREMARAEGDIGLTYPSRFRLPAGLDRLVFTEEMLPEERRPMNAAAGHLAGGPVIVFDQAFRSGPYERAHRRTWAATESRVGAPTLIVEPRFLEPSVVLDGLREVALESDEFNERFRVRTEDPRFATTFLDQRTLAWLLTEPTGRTYVAFGSWVACMERRMPVGELPGLIAAAHGIAAQIPTVVHGLYPPPDQVLHRSPWAQPTG